MNCADAEKLLSLYARVDLDRSSQTAVAAHLESCTHCRQLADEYKNIQSWIRLHGPPEFSEEFFAGIRENVLRQIRQTSDDSSSLRAWLRKLLAPTLPKTTFAAATAALLIVFFAIGLLAFREYRSRSEFIARDETLRSEFQKGATAVNANATTLRTEDKSQPLHEVKNGWGSFKRVRHRIARTVPTVSVQDALAPATELTSTDSNSERLVDSGLSDEQAPLRVEIQTRNPDIRIIWFAPNPRKSSVTN
jgi:hypothetical protein